MRGRVLAIAGSDSSGGAGIQADIKTIAALGGYAATAITAVTAQDTMRVHEMRLMPAEFVARQIVVVLDDVGADAVKIGMLGDASIVAAVCDTLVGRDLPLVVDPVMAATAGQSLLSGDGLDVVCRRLLPIASVITPNLSEAEALTGMPIPDLPAMYRAATAILALGASAVLLTGGHLPGDRVIDLLATRDGIEAFDASRIATRHTHGTGCTLASAIATGLAQDMNLRDAVVRARDYVRAAIAAAPGYGAGHGPLNHAVTVQP